jgi:hypothetical protein
MRSKISKATDNPWAALAAAVVKSGVREPPGKGWVGADELGKHMECCQSTAKQIVRKLLEQGKAERFAGSAETAGGLIRSRVWFRLKS